MRIFFLTHKKFLRKMRLFPKKQKEIHREIKHFLKKKNK